MSGSTRASTWAFALMVSLVISLAACSEGDDQAYDPELRQELLEMREADQAERTGQADWTRESDRARTERLREIIDEHGWPTPEMVGDDGASAAWLIAQHSDLDVSFQERVLTLMEEAMADDAADPTEVAFLTDRVAINRGRDQTYGTQVSCVDGRAVPKPLADPGNVEQRRKDVGLEPLEEYLAQFDCTAELPTP